MTAIKSPAGDMITVLDDDAHRTILGISERAYAGSMQLGDQRAAVLRALWLHGAYRHETGWATALLIADVSKDPDVRWVRAVLKAPTVEVLVEQTIRGKRCYLIRLKALPARWVEAITGATLEEHLGLPVIEEQPGPPGDLGEPIPVSLPPELEIVLPAQVDDGPEPAEIPAETPPPPAPLVPVVPLAEPHVATIRLELDVDPSLARLILDVVERGRGLRPMDRDAVHVAIGQAVDKVTRQQADGMGRVNDRIVALEVELERLRRAAGAVGIQPAAKPAPRPERPPKPNFRELGVKNSKQRELMTELWNDGWTFTKRPGGHIRADKPGFAPQTMPTTASDHRSILNNRAQFRAAGANV